MDLMNLLMSIIDSYDIGTEVVYASPEVSFKLIPTWREKEKEIANACLAIPQEDLFSKELLKRHTCQDESMALLLFAIGDKVGVWSRFPPLEGVWNLPHYPTAVLLRRPDGVPVNNTTQTGGVFDEIDSL